MSDEVQVWKDRYYELIDCVHLLEQIYYGYGSQLPESVEMAQILDRANKVIGEVSGRPWTEEDALYQPVEKTEKRSLECPVCHKVNQEVNQEINQYEFKCSNCGCNYDFCVCRNCNAKIGIHYNDDGKCFKCNGFYDTKDRFLARHRKEDLRRLDAWNEVVGVK